MAKRNPFAPCQLGEHGDTFYLIFNDFDPTADTFDELGQDGGGYGWHGVVDALIRMKAPKLKRKLHFDPEASLFAVNSKDLDALKQVAELIREAINSPELLREAIENADPELMD